MQSRNDCNKFPVIADVWMSEGGTYCHTFLKQILQHLQMLAAVPTAKIYLSISNALTTPYSTEAGVEIIDVENLFRHGYNLSYQ